MLNLWRQQLGKVPESVWQDTELQVLILADNGLIDLPPEIGHLHRLATLDLGHNHLWTTSRCWGSVPRKRRGVLRRSGSRSTTTTCPNFRMRWER
ncbi:leucine-rich repeat domain-containing protein [Streptomyces sp. 2-1]|uniref:leucine-rich repeat domain-containing protein n=1 Tax=Streptomyces sp. 2-1 TaxID=412710 RepID=UPI003AFA8CF8